MTDAQSVQIALDKLIKAVEAGGILPAIDWEMFGWNDECAMCCGLILQAHLGSLDAAYHLHEALLPGWTRGVDATAPECGIDVELFHAGLGEVVKAINDIEARAWLLAILRAYRSVQA